MREIEQKTNPQAQLEFIAEKPPSESQIKIIQKLMGEIGVCEQDMQYEGFPPLQKLTGGREGTASRMIDWLIKSKRFTPEHYNPL